MAIAITIPAQAGSIAPTAATTETMNQLVANKLMNRLEEIKAMDKTSLSGQEKRTLRKEVRAIKKATDNGGVYLSVGAVIIIILLLILLL